MLKEGVKWESGASTTIFGMWCYLICSNTIMFACCSSHSKANTSSSWKNLIATYNTYNTITYGTDATSYIILYNADFRSEFSLGFFKPNQTSSDCYLSIFMGTWNDNPVVLWSANRNHPVRENATLNLTSGGDLVLHDVDGSFVWSSNTSGLSVQSMQLEPADGNLVLLDEKQNSIWKAYDHPTDSLMYTSLRYDLHQGFPKGFRLTSSVSTSNYSTGMFYASWEFDGIHAFYGSNLPIIYRFLDNQSFQSKLSSLSNTYNYSQDLLYIRLDQNGHLNLLVYEDAHNPGQFNSSYIGDIFEDGIFGDCAYPTTCGTYGICYDGGKCRCPARNDTSLKLFEPSRDSDPESGCTPLTPLSCPDTHKLQSFLELDNVTYSNFTPSIIDSDIATCKAACLKQCSCKAVFFHNYNDTATTGNCTLPEELLTLWEAPRKGLGYKAIAYIKVQQRIQTTPSTAPAKASPKKNNKLIPFVVASLLASALVTAACFCAFMIQKWRRAKRFNPSLDFVVDTVTQFPYKSLKKATQDFQTRLGRGGFGSVFEGTLEDGTKVAVKRLDSVQQGHKEFLAEVNTIGSFHHFNLVKLIGFCADESHRLLVYEFMWRGSLEKWIFKRDESTSLDWNIRQRIILGVATGLEYLHEHCNQNVIHFDIKPQNILLDKDFNAKIADFGLAKLVDRDHSQVVTMARGTPGYMAPEIINGHTISSKVDVYSFGVLVLEVLCGRRNSGSSESDCLKNLVKVEADDNQLSALIDKHDEDMQQHKEEALKMMKIAICCLQPQFNRPTMLMVVKALQDLPNMETLTDLSYLSMVQEATPREANNFSNPPTESILSGPR